MRVPDYCMDTNSCARTKSPYRHIHPCPQQITIYAHDCILSDIPFKVFNMYNTYFVSTQDTKNKNASQTIKMRRIRIPSYLVLNHQPTCYDIKLVVKMKCSEQFISPRVCMRSDRCLFFSYKELAQYMRHTQPHNLLR